MGVVDGVLFGRDLRIVPCGGASVIATEEIINKEKARLRASFRLFSLAGLRWDYCCNVSEETRQVILNELARRGVSMGTFENLGRGDRHGGLFC